MNANETKTKDTFRVTYWSAWMRGSMIVDAEDSTEAVRLVHERASKPGYQWSIINVTMRCRGESRGRIVGHGKCPCQRFGSEAYCRNHAPKEQGN